MIIKSPLTHQQNIVTNTTVNKFCYFSKSQKSWKPCSLTWLRLCRAHSFFWNQFFLYSLIVIFLIRLKIKLFEIIWFKFGKMKKPKIWISININPNYPEDYLTRNIFHQIFIRPWIGPNNDSMIFWKTKSKESSQKWTVSGQSGPSRGVNRTAINQRERFAREGCPWIKSGRSLRIKLDGLFELVSLTRYIR